MVLPTGDFTVTDDVEVIEEATLPTKTYRLDFEKGLCLGMTDGLEAIRQAIFKVLSTIRFEHLIYSDDYGFENPIGKDEIFVRAEMPRSIHETLLQDERIISIENFEMDIKGDTGNVTFTALTTYGDVDILQEVSDFV